MKNILIIPPFNPYPLVSGGHQAIFNGIAVLEGLANVYVCVPTTESMHKRGEDRGLERALPFVHVLYYIEPSSRHTIRWYWSVLCNKMQRYLPKAKKQEVSVAAEVVKQCELQAIYEIPEEKKRFVLDAIKRYKIDTVQVEMLRDIKIVQYLPENIESIFVQHEIKFVKDELYLQTFDNVPQAIKEQYLRNKQEEIDLHNLYNKVVTLSPIDTEKLKDAGVTSPILTSLAVVNQKATAAQSNERVTKVLTYVGPEGHYPNYEGVMWFLENCWEKLQKKDSGYTLKIIGLWSEQTAAELDVRYEGKVQCVGFVDDLAAALAGTTMIVPLNIGSGIRMKILEAAQLNVPVVTTPVGGEGLPLKDGENCFVTSDADTFVEDILRLQDKALRERFVENTRQAIAKNYSLEALRENRRELYEV